MHEGFIWGSQAVADSCRLVEYRKLKPPMASSAACGMSTAECWPREFMQCYVQFCSDMVVWTLAKEHSGPVLLQVCMGWRDSFDISGLELRGPRALGESPMGRCEGIHSQASLWDMLMASWGRREPFSLGFQKPWLDLAPDAAGQPRISHFIQAGASPAFTRCCIAL